MGATGTTGATGAAGGGLPLINGSVLVSAVTIPVETIVPVVTTPILPAGTYLFTFTAFVQPILGVLGTGPIISANFDFITEPDETIVPGSTIQNGIVVQINEDEVVPLPALMSISRIVTLNGSQSLTVQGSWALIVGTEVGFNGIETTNTNGSLNWVKIA